MPFPPSRGLCIDCDAHLNNVLAEEGIVPVPEAQAEAAAAALIQRVCLQMQHAPHPLLQDIVALGHRGAAGEHKSPLMNLIPPPKGTMTAYLILSPLVQAGEHDEERSEPLLAVDDLVRSPRTLASTGGHLA